MTIQTRTIQRIITQIFGYLLFYFIEIYRIRFPCNCLEWIDSPVAWLQRCFQFEMGSCLFISSISLMLKFILLYVIPCAYNAVLFFLNLAFNKSERRRRTDYCISESYLPFKVNLSYQTLKIRSQWFQRETINFPVEKVCLWLLKSKSMNLSTRKSEVTK